MSDKHFSNVVLLVGFEGADGATTFVDDGPTGHAVTANGNAQIDTGQFKFGASSGLFDGNGDFLTAPDHADWALSNLPFTIEGFVRFAGLNTAERGCCLLAQYANSGNQRSWGLYYNNDGGNHNLAFIRSADGVNTTTLNGPWPGGAPALNTWYHIAADRDLEDVLRVYVLGQVVGQADLTGFTFHNSTDLLNVGRLNSSSGFRRFMHGWLDELRFTNGVARYAGSFVPPQGPFSRYKALGVTSPVRPVAIGMALEP
jgi:Concanavalin A-like lectin/glucanases superfamily